MLNYKIIKIDENHFMKEFPDGTKHWYKNHNCHREDGPAIECPNGDKEWYINDYLIFYLEDNMFYFDNKDVLNHESFIFNNIYLLNKETK